MYLGNLDITDMFSEVTINNHKCHVSGFKAVVFSCESIVH